MAAAEQPAARRRARKISAPGVEELGTRLSDMFETKVKIQIGRAKGRIVAEGMSVRATEEAVAMAAADRPTAKRRSRNISAPGVEELGSRLSDRFETKVKIQIGRSKGKIVVEFGSVDDLQRIIGVMAPDITGRRE